MEARVAENLLLDRVDMVVDEIEHANKFSSLQREILRCECSVVVAISPQEI